MAEDSPITIALVILTYNEVEGVRVLGKHLCDAEALRVDEVFAVDGGSTDGTLAVYEELGIEVHAQTSKGRGEAMRMAAQTSECSHLIFFSPDGNEDYKDIPRFREYFARGYDLVIASRMCRGARNEEDDRRLKPRKWANNLFNLAANVVFGLRGQPFVTDSINGFRGVRRTWLLETGTDAVGYTIEYQMTMRALAARLPIVEFPTHEGDRIGGESYAYAVPTGLRFLRCLAAETGRRLSTRARGADRSR